jgi:acetolactate synthase I/II/III large subunit
MFDGARRPLIIFGAGVQCCREQAIAWAEAANVPVVLTWGAADLLHDDHPLNVGRFGTHGVRYANFAVQTSDCIVSVGSRLDTKSTGSPVSSFAPRAKIIMVDIDAAEIDKFKALEREISPIHMDAKDFFRRNTCQYADSAQWQEKIAQWKKNYPCLRTGAYSEIESISNLSKKNDVIVSDTGCVLGWLMQGFKFKGQRFVHAFNNTPMGYGIPAAIGAHLATGRRVICLSGDGGASVHTPELATIVHHNWPIKIIVFNNHGHAMCRQTQRQWLNARYVATDDKYLSIARFDRVAMSYDMRVHARLDDLFATDKPGLMEIFVDPDEGIAPQVRFGAGLEDGDPRLPIEELREVLDV